MTAAGRRFDDVLEGDELDPSRSSSQRIRCARMPGPSDHYFPRFTDDEGARREGLPGMITPGNMSMGLLTTLVDGWAGPGALRRLGTTFRGLVLPDRTIRLCGAVTQKDEATRTAELDVWMESDEGERLVIGTATVTLD